MAHTKGTRPEDDRDTADMSVEAQELMEAVAEIMAILGTANMWDYLPVMRWFDVFGVRNSILKSVNRMDAFMGRLIDAERRRLADLGGEGDNKSMLAVLLTLQKREPDVYTPSMITGLCVVGASSLPLLYVVEQSQNQLIQLIYVFPCQFLHKGAKRLAFSFSAHL
jgi:hypothetical protein